MTEPNLKRITTPLSLNFDETCKQHHHIGDLPCPWPDCSRGIKDDAYISITPGTNEERKIIRKSWIAVNGDQRFSWDDTTFFSYFGVKKIIREEMLRIFGTEPAFEDIIYHYTSINGFFNIINSNELWLTDYRYMNDASEINHGIDLAKNILGKIRKEIIYKEKKKLLKNGRMQFKTIYLIESV